MIAKGIAVIGSTTIDKIVRGDRSWLKIGGVTTYAGITYSRHGIRTLAITNIAKRDPEIRDRLQKEKIIVCNGPTEATTHFINYINEANRRQKILRCAASINRNQITEYAKRLSFVHLGPLHPSDIDTDAIKSLNRPNLYVVLDAQGFVRSVRNQNVYPVVSKHLSAALRISHMVKANDHEYQAIIDFYQADLTELMNRFKINEFIVTSGKKGGFVKATTGETIQYKSYKAFSAMPIPDPTGAGDIFLAAYVIGRLFCGRMIVDACNYAAKLVARQICGNYIKSSELRLAH
jgi:sugar/nucleoside kinase (ribokinase family)